MGLGKFMPPCMARPLEKLGVKVGLVSCPNAEQLKIIKIKIFML